MRFGIFPILMLLVLMPAVHAVAQSDGSGSVATSADRLEKMLVRLRGEQSGKGRGTALEVPESTSSAPKNTSARLDALLSRLAGQTADQTAGDAGQTEGQIEPAPPLSGVFHGAATVAEADLEIRLVLPLDRRNGEITASLTGTWAGRGRLEGIVYGRIATRENPDTADAVDLSLYAPQVSGENLVLSGGVETVLLHGDASQSPNPRSYEFQLKLSGSDRLLQGTVILKRDAGGFPIPMMGDITFHREEGPIGGSSRVADIGAGVQVAVGGVGNAGRREEMRAILSGFSFPGEACWNYPLFHHVAPVEEWDDHIEGQHEVFARLHTEYEVWLECINQSANADVVALHEAVRRMGGTSAINNDRFELDLPSICECLAESQRVIRSLEERQINRRQANAHVHVIHEYLEMRRGLFGFFVSPEYLDDYRQKMTTRLDRVDNERSPRVSF